ncbi:hypothetical protein HDV00_007031 [Rhizophlyctis rosea]|nr:hypothetical protein HDV00_007031 [Rhizophlyctis rosea]
MTEEHWTEPPSQIPPTPATEEPPTILAEGGVTVTEVVTEEEVEEGTGVVEERAEGEGVGGGGWWCRGWWGWWGGGLLRRGGTSGGLSAFAHKLGELLPTKKEEPEEEKVVTNVSHKVSSEYYNPNVPYIAGFSNGVAQPDPITVEVKKGAFPDWLKGCLYRNGPGMFDIEYPDRRGKDTKVFSFQHWFDGLAMVHRFQLDGTKNVQYRSRFTASSMVQLVREHAKRTGKQVDTNLGQSGAKKWGSDPSACSINHAITPNFPFGRAVGPDHLVLSDYSNTLQEIDPITLIPQRAIRYDEINEAFTGNRAGPRPVRDQKEGGIVNFTMQTAFPGSSATYKMFGISKDDCLTPPGYLFATINGRASKAHSLAITSNYIILIEYPYSFNSFSAMFGKALDQVTKFDPNEQTVFHVIDRHRREQICVYRAPPCFSFKILNAYEEEECVNIDMNVYDDDEIVKCFELKNLRTAEMPPLPVATVRRYRLGRISEVARLYKVGKDKGSQALFHQLTDYSLEFATINPSNEHVQHRYAWGVSISQGSRKYTNMIWDSIVKADFKDNSQKEWKEFGCFPGEVIMIPRPATTEGSQSSNGSQEDDGVLLSVVLDSRTHKSFLLCLDAADLTELGRAELEFAIPFGLHGAWAPNCCV